MIIIINMIIMNPNLDHVHKNINLKRYSLLAKWAFNKTWLHTFLMIGKKILICIYSFSKHFYPKQLTNENNTSSLTNIRLTPNGMSHDPSQFNLKQFFFFF